MAVGAVTGGSAELQTARASTTPCPSRYPSASCTTPPPCRLRWDHGKEMAWQRQRREHSVSSQSRAHSGSSSHRHEAAAMKRGHDYSSYPRTLHIDPAGSKFSPTGVPSSRTHFPTTVAEISVRRETRRWMKAMPVSD
ncbi:hypothetical protein XELAEV_18022667mg [Xenopus laevis]|uniref:Uncharacterized protein n=1 Tax=Xenopus laevis TaxID=8355 RepID=A0A974HND8_XENLA|nr:hypothetical protein XELAEV_18022667mg [Xenopus laevis]